MESKLGYGFRKFADFYNYIRDPASQEEIVCPGCGGPVQIVVRRSFDINKSGKAIITCASFGCGFNSKPIVVEAIA